MTRRASELRAFARAWSAASAPLLAAHARGQQRQGRIVQAQLRPEPRAVALRPPLRVDAVVHHLGPAVAVGAQRGLQGAADDEYVSHVRRHLTVDGRVARRVPAKPLALGAVEPPLAKVDAPAAADELDAAKQQEVMRRVGNGRARGRRRLQRGERQVLVHVVRVHHVGSKVRQRAAHAAQHRRIHHGHRVPKSLRIARLQALHLHRAVRRLGGRVWPRGHHQHVVTARGEGARQPLHHHPRTAPVRRGDRCQPAGRCAWMPSERV